MTSNPQNNPNNKQTRFLILRVLVIILVVGGVTLWLERISRPASISASVTPTLQINLPMTEYPTIPASAPEFTVNLQRLNDSGVTGKVTFKDIAGTVAILLYVQSPGGGGEDEEALMPAELHHGSCAAPGDLAYPMTAPDAGQSETDLSINLKEFNTQRPMAVILYRSAQDHTPIACGDVP